MFISNTKKKKSYSLLTKLFICLFQIQKKIIFTGTYNVFNVSMFSRRNNMYLKKKIEKKKKITVTKLFKTVQLLKKINSKITHI